MVGRTISHYRIVEKLDGGGMGVVYKATDERLNRFVALKFLSSDLTSDADANARFRREAQAASALDHPNICTIHEIDETPSGELFLTMAYYDGETLKSRLARGPLSVREAVDLAAQIARGLACAHAAGIVHRDIKPANVMVGRDGLAKILDFGIAKLVGTSDLTRTGTTVGTVAYMSPEQIRGLAVDARTDVWSLGVVLYELLAGTRPFAGKEDLAVVSGILDDAPPPFPADRHLPPALERIVFRALSKQAAERYATGEDILKDLLEVQAALTSPAIAAAPPSKTSRRALAGAAAVALLAIGAFAASNYTSGRRTRLARNEGIPQLQALIGRDDYAVAFRLATDIAKDIPNDPVLTALWPQFSAPVNLVTNPEGAEVFVQPYAQAGEDWQRLGVTPLSGVRLPRGTFRIRLEKAGFQSQLLASANPGPLLRNGGPPPPGRPEMVVALRPNGQSPEMVWVSGGLFPVGLTTFGIDRPIAIDEFLIDRYEVKNSDYKQFVQNGGYRPDADHWRDLAPADVVRTFIDSTGRPGPAPWELGEVPAGQGDLPVTGVSWYEAVAYCRGAGKSLPSLFHWARAALSPVEISAPLAPAIIPLSNLNGKGLAPVGTFRGLGSYGTYDMGGNAREWTWNEGAGGKRWMLGGAWQEPDYMLTLPTSLPPLDRSPLNGFRCARYGSAGDVPPALLAHTETFGRDNRTAKAVSDEVFEIFKRQFAYTSSELNARVEAVDTTAADWTRETITFEAAGEPGRLTAYLFLPKHGNPPYQLVVLFPGIGPFIARGSSKAVQLNVVDYIVRSGRAIIYPVYGGSFERWSPFLSLEGEAFAHMSRTRLLEWRRDIGHAIDLATARPDIDKERIAYVGTSFGASTAVPVVALEPRFKAAVLQASGFTYRDLPPETDPLNYLSRITIPVLMMGGKHDYVFPLETSQKPMFERLGTRSDHKRHVIMEAGHTSSLPRGQLIREGLAWLDRYLGPVNAAAH